MQSMSEDKEGNGDSLGALPNFNDKSMRRERSTVIHNKGRETFFYQPSDVIALQNLKKKYQGEEDNETEDKAIEEEYSYEHIRLLYLISCYARCATDATGKECWIRRLSILVLLFRGITMGVFDFDYAPASLLVSHEGNKVCII